MHIVRVILKTFANCVLWTCINVLMLLCTNGQRPFITGGDDTVDCSDDVTQPVKLIAPTNDHLHQYCTIALLDTLHHGSRIKRTAIINYLFYFILHKLVFEYENYVNYMNPAKRVFISIVCCIKCILYLYTVKSIITYQQTSRKFHQR